MLCRHPIHPVILTLQQLERAHHNAVSAQMGQADLGDVGNPLLLFLLARAMEQADEPLPSQKRLAEQLHVSPATVAVSLKSLERGGYVRKEPDPTDARRNQVYITDKGQRAVARCVRVFETVDRQILAGFSPEELERLAGYHRRMLENLNRIGGDRACCSGSHPPFGKE